MVKTIPPKPDKYKGQRSPLYFQRILPAWKQPSWQEAEFWRQVVLNQPFAVICRETLISNLLALDWKIEPRDARYRDELKSEIDYYTRFFEYTGDYSYSEIVEWIGTDLLDLPFGGAVELGYFRDDPNEHLVWIEPLDGATLFPTNNSKWPVGQILKNVPTKQVFFPKHAINRIYMSPRPSLERKGWGMPPPEKIYLSLELLRRGDTYYANLLLDTPEVGILDLMDMDKSSAEEWVESWRNLLQGIDAFKIPVLYEHTSDAKFIQFNRSPSELLFDKTILRYGAICCAGYGMSLSDIGIQAVSKSGETLAGSIRQERRTRRTGFARLKRYFENFFNRMLLAELKFSFIDLDDEVSVALGRARLAGATAFGQLINLGVFTPEEARQQIIADGLITIAVPENIEMSSSEPISSKPSPERPSLLGRPVSPSSGGIGEIKSHLSSIFSSDNPYLKSFLAITRNKLSDEIVGEISVDIREDVDDFWKEILGDIPELGYYNIQKTQRDLLNLVDWHLFSRAVVIEELLSAFSDVIGDNMVLQNKLLRGFDNILSRVENLIAEKLVSLSVLYNTYGIIDEELPELDTLLVSLKFWASKVLSEEISKFILKELESTK